MATDDPSTELAPYTADRLRKACATPTPPRLLAPLRVFAVEPLDEVFKPREWIWPIIEGEINDMFSGLRTAANDLDVFGPR